MHQKPKTAGVTTEAKQSNSFRKVHSLQRINLNMNKFIFICLMCWCFALQTSGMGVTLQEGPKNTSVTEGENVILDCIFYRLSPTNFVYWYRHETRELISLNRYITDIEQDRRTRYTIPSRDSTFSLNMEDVKGTDSGTYSCGIITNLFNLNMEEGIDHLATATLTVLPTKLGNSTSTPRCTMSAVEEPKIQNDLVQLTCLRNTDQDFEGSLQAELIWYRVSPHDVISEPQRDRAVTNLRLNPADNGVNFTCRLQYPRLRELGRVVGGECSVMPLRIPPVSWLEQSGEVLVQEGSDVTLTCNGTGIPAVTAYLWRIHPEIPENRYDLEDNGKVLRINDLQNEDNSLNVTCLVQIASGLTSDSSSSVILKISANDTTNMNYPSTFSLPAVVVPIILMLMVGILLGIMWKVIQHKRQKSVPVPKRPNDDAKPTTPSNVPATPSPPSPRLAYYDYPFTHFSVHPDKNYTDLETSIQHEYLDLTGKNPPSNNEYTDYLATEGSKTEDLDADVYETYEIDN